MNNVKVWKFITFISVLTLKDFNLYPWYTKHERNLYYYNFIPGMFPRERSLRRYTLVTGACFRGKTNFSTRTHYVKRVRIRSYSGRHFPAFGMNTERYGVSLRIQSECGKMRTRITRNTDTFYTMTIFAVNPQTIITFFCKWQNFSFQMQE